MSYKVIFLPKKQLQDVNVGSLLTIFCLGKKCRKRKKKRKHSEA
jgi:hypothetical protein